MAPEPNNHETSKLRRPTADFCSVFTLLHHKSRKVSRKCFSRSKAVLVPIMSIYVPWQRRRPKQMSEAITLHWPTNVASTRRNPKRKRKRGQPIDNISKLTACLLAAEPPRVPRKLRLEYPGAMYHLISRRNPLMLDGAAEFCDHRSASPSPSDPARMVTFAGRRQAGASCQYHHFRPGGRLGAARRVAGSTQARPREMLSDSAHRRRYTCRQWQATSNCCGTTRGTTSKNRSPRS